MSDISSLSITDAGYPQILREIHSPPGIIYVRGKMASEELCVAVVGTRKPTRYGIEATETIVKKLASLAPHVTIVSGLATGIDTAAHRAALKTGLRTIGVLGSGMDAASFFPPQNKTLANEIVRSGGAVLSEYEEGTPALKHHFPERNRIVAGLSKGVVVIEARERSGALITARLAVEENREVFAVPGPIYSLNSAGPNALIQRGAKLIRNAEDILEELGIVTDAPEVKNIALTKEERALLDTISDEARTIDELRELTDISTADILSLVSMLELKGLIKSLGADQWTRI